MTKYCSSCGSEIRDEGRYCGSCGKEFSNEPTKKEVAASGGNLAEIPVVTNENRDKPYFARLFSGRVNRKNYLVGLLLFYISTFVFSYVMGVFLSGSMTTEQLEEISWVPVLLTFPFGLSFAVRRAHDIGKTGAYLLLNLIPVVGFIIALNILLKAGDRETNQFGEPPGSSVDLGRLLGF
jgi:uncharacterized membrane protein YhaH (DUF805 family)